MATTTRLINSLPCRHPEFGDPCVACAVRDLGVCAALEDGELLELQRAVRHLTFDPGQSILTEGEPADHVFIVVTGAAALQKSMVDGRRQITALLLPGDVLGMTSEGTFHYSAEALTKVELCRIPVPVLDRMCARFPAFEKHLREVLGHEFCEAQSQLLWLGRKSASERLASFLLMLGERAEHRGQASNPVRLFMTRADIADCLGLTEETVSRTFTHLVNQKLISLPKRSEVLIEREGALRDLAEGTASGDAGHSMR
jgi:CRP/FNR family transcriptional regulator